MSQELIAGLLTLGLPLFGVGYLMLRKNVGIFRMYTSMLIIGLGYLGLTGALDDIGRKILSQTGMAEQTTAPEPAATPAAETAPAPEPAPAAETPEAETPAAETPAAETPAAEPPAADAPASEPPAETAPATP